MALSEELESWLEQDRPKTIGSLTDLMDERSFAFVLMLLLFPSALPLPTGGVTHLLELAALLVAVQMVLGREELWFPRRVRGHELGGFVTGKAVPVIVRRVRWFERWARPRAARILDARVAQSALGLVILVFVVGALVAPPFSGLDTLPALGVVIVCLGLLFGDALIVGLGLGAGSVGIALIVVLGSVVWSFF